MAKKKKERKQRRLFLLLLLLLCTGVFLGTATYAWFTANKTVTVNPIDVNVEAKSGLQISTDGTNWKSVITTTDISGATATYAAAVNQLPSTLEPVSTIGTVDANGQMEMFLGNVSSNDSGDFTLSTTKQTDKSGSTGAYVAYDLFLRTETAAPIYLTTNSNVIFKDDQDTGIKNATRVGFVVLGNTSSDSSISDIQALNSGAASTKKIWEPNYDAHTSYGVANARDTYGITSLTAGKGNAIVSYDGVKAEIPSTANVTLSNANKTSASTYFDTVTPDIKTIDGFTDYQSFIALSKGVTKIRVYMWIEGQDVDCENNASGGNIEFNLQFSTSESAG